MTELEMLTFAAKAGGIAVVRSRLNDPIHRDLLIVDSARNPYQMSGPWNSITDDGDALRLAVRLRFGIKDFAPHDDEPDATPDNTPSVGMIEIWRESDDDDPLYVEWYKAGFNRYAATRRAITNAAALIGKDMP